jgi:membrane-bound metal-dependent hydrolase YbcI (DUF457 family)
VGHALGGIAAAWALVPPESRRRHAVGSAALVAAFGVAPDLDLFLPVHRGVTHSVGAAVLAGLAVLAVTRNIRWAAAAAAAWTSHVLLDWLGTDTRPPIGVMAFWPFSTQYVESSLHLFPAVSRRYRLAEFWVYNLAALGVELAILVPVTWLVVRACRRRGGQP